MKDDDSIPISSPTLISNKKASPPDSSSFNRGRYKFCALCAIILLAFWSMLTGTVTLRYSAANLNRLSDDITVSSSVLDVLEIEEREKIVEYMWDVYTNSRRICLPRFWQRAFVAAYEDLISDAPAVREAAIFEIAKMSVDSIDLLPPPSRSMSLRELSLHGRRS
ncbi:hypothetical protein QVD17_04943 [Tagetes erecta]|uniref:Uncharacterized protein n=1 Tax=Tagetes erecta TaxID=13708 RepID=A0AAD8PA50_TARER|nr:hypothetical protein QVD17_04943 [Tagetes erecta]